MGACSFETIGYGSTMSEAYRDACSQAEYECGHDPYNGTISTTSGFIDQTSLYEKFKEDGDVAQFYETATDNTNKWEDCWGAKIGDNKFVFVGWAAE